MTAWSFSGPQKEYVEEEEAYKHIDGLVARFEKSPEFRAYATEEDSVANVGLIFELGWQYEGLLPSQCDFNDFRDILLSVFPRKVSCPPEDAEFFVAELRAYLAFAQREFGFAAAEECLAELTPEFVKHFEERMADRSLFGMAKSFLTGGHEAGFDMSSEEGLQAAILAQNSGRLNAPLREFDTPPIRLVDTPFTQKPDKSGKTNGKKKNKRRIKKKSRRKNR